MDVWELVSLGNALLLVVMYLAMVVLTVKIDLPRSQGVPSGKRAFFTLLVVVTGGVAILTILYAAFCQFPRSLTQ